MTDCVWNIYPLRDEFDDKSRTIISSWFTLVYRWRRESISSRLITNSEAFASELVISKNYFFDTTYMMLACSKKLF